MEILEHVTSRLAVEAELFGLGIAGEPIARNPKFPKYSIVRELLGVLPGLTKRDLRGLIDAVHLESGSKGAPVSWKNPEVWIKERLDKHEIKAAARIFEGTKRSVNPARIYGAYLLIRRYGLLSEVEGIYCENRHTSEFEIEPSSTVFRVDYFEGNVHILHWLNGYDDLARESLNCRWAELCSIRSQMRSDRSIRSALSQRTSNLKSRGLINETGRMLRLSESGRQYVSWIADTLQADRIANLLN